MMDEDVRLRVACDRCHSQKLRCPKRQGSETCDRCKKAGASCLYSPFRQKKPSANEKLFNGYPRNNSKVDSKSSKDDCIDLATSLHKRKRSISPKEDAVQNLGHNFDAGISSDAEPAELSYVFTNVHGEPMLESSLMDMELDFQGNCPQLDYNLLSPTTSTDKISSLLNLTSPSDQQLGYLSSEELSYCPVASSDMIGMAPSSVAGAPQIGTKTQQPMQSVTQCIRQLSELSLSLFDHSNTIPPQTIHESISGNHSHQDTMNLRAQNYYSYNADETFSFTQELIDLYPVFINFFIRRTILNPDTPGLRRSNEATEEVEQLGPISPSISNSLQLDHSSILLLLSCHTRLIDIYNELFKHMKICINQRGMPYTEAQKSFAAPKSKIGNYIPPTSTATTMQMLLLIQFATSLRDLSVELDEGIQDLDSLANPSGETTKHLSMGSSHEVRERANAMLQQLGSLKGIMLRQGHMA